MAAEQVAELKKSNDLSLKDTNSPSKQKKHRRKKSLTNYNAFYLMLIPGILVLLVNNYLPMSGVIMPFKDYKYDGNNYFSSLASSKWTGFENFKFLFLGNFAVSAMINTILYNIVFIALDIVVPVALAIAMSEMWSKKAGNTYQTFLFLPYFISWVAVSYVVYAFFVDQNGFVNSGILKALGMPSEDFYHNPMPWPFILTFFHLWKYTGYNLIVYIASLSGINGEYYEAAELDGATKWQQVKYITLPMLKTTIVILTLIAVGRIFNGDFDLFYNVPMHTGAIVQTTEVLDTYVYKCLSSIGDVCMASAGGIFQAVVGCVVVTVANFAVKRVDPDSALF